MKVVAIVQARMGSTRLPNKVMRHICGVPMIELLLARLARARQVHQVVLATSVDERNQPLAEHVEGLGYQVWRGSEDDVLDRYVQAARAHSADVVVRITGDCPLLDPEIVDEVVTAFNREAPDYASNTLRRTWPRGLDTEVVALSALEIAGREAAETYERVHVTPFLYHHAERFRLLPVVGAHDCGSLRWTVDEADDLAMVREVYAALGKDNTFGWRQVLELVQEHPEIAEINRHVVQKVLEQC